MIHLISHLICCSYVIKYVKPLRFLWLFYILKTSHYTESTNSHFFILAKSNNPSLKLPFKDEVTFIWQPFFFSNILICGQYGRLPYISAADISVKVGSDANRWITKLWPNI